MVLPKGCPIVARLVDGMESAQGEGVVSVGMMVGRGMGWLWPCRNGRNFSKQEGLTVDAQSVTIGNQVVGVLCDSGMGFGPNVGRNKKQNHHGRRT